MKPAAYDGTTTLGTQPWTKIWQKWEKFVLPIRWWEDELNKRFNYILDTLSTEYTQQAFTHASRIFHLMLKIILAGPINYKIPSTGTSGREWEIVQTLSLYHLSVVCSTLLTDRVVPIVFIHCKHSGYIPHFVYFCHFCSILCWFISTWFETKWESFGPGGNFLYPFQNMSINYIKST